MPLSVPQLISEGFGTSDGSKTYPIPVPSQIGITAGAASFADGFPPLTRTALDAGGIPPGGEDLNGILYMISAHVALINSGQPYQYNNAQATAISGYGLGALLQNATNDGFWLNISNGNTTNPDTGGAGWVPLSNTGKTIVALTSGTVTLSAAQASKGLIIFTGTLTGNVVVNFPANTSQQWVVVNECTGSYTVQAQTTAAGNQVTLPQGGFTQAQNCFSDGTNLYSNNVSTAGLAPLASPAFTGTPTAPTATPATATTTQIANTTFVQQAIAAAIAGLAPLASPTFTGTPSAPTATPGTDNVQLATTAFVQAALGALEGSAGHGSFQFGPWILNFGTVTFTSDPMAITFQTTYPTACIGTLPIGITNVGSDIPILAITSPPSSSRTGFSCISSIPGTGTTIFYLSLGY